MNINSGQALKGRNNLSVLLFRHRFAATMTLPGHAAIFSSASGSLSESESNGFEAGKNGGLVAAF